MLKESGFQSLRGLRELIMDPCTKFQQDPTIGGWLILGNPSMK